LFVSPPENVSAPFRGAIAAEQLEALETRFRTLMADEILALADGFEAALETSRRAESQHNGLHSRVFGNASPPGRTGRIYEQRMPLFAILAQCRLHMERSRTNRVG
jgi:hypothetical protein